MPKHDSTNTIRPADLVRIRRTALAYLLDGGAVFIEPEDSGDDSRDSHVGTIREERHPKDADQFEQLLKQHVPEYDPHEALWTAVWELVTHEGEAGYLFGVCVGLELATLTSRASDGILSKRPSGCRATATARTRNRPTKRSTRKRARKGVAR